MAERNDWCVNLNNSALFDALRKNAGKSKGTLQAKSILAINDGTLYVWDAYNAALLTTNLKALKSQPSHRSLYQVILRGREGVLCGMRNFCKVYFAEFSLRNVPQITPESFSAFRNSAFRRIQIKSNQQLRPILPNS